MRIWGNEDEELGHYGAWTKNPNQKYVQNGGVHLPKIRVKTTKNIFYFSYFI